MAEMKIGINIPQQSMIYLAFCLAGVLIFVFVGILPANRSLADLDRQTAEAKYRIEEQRALTPFYQTLQSRIEKKASEILPLPEKAKLSQSSLNTIPVSFGTAARMSGMSLITATPNLNALTGDLQSLSVNVILRGEFINFRKFLINLGGIPYVQHIEEISIQDKPDSKEFRIKVWVSVG